MVASLWPKHHHQEDGLGKTLSPVGQNPCSTCFFYMLTHKVTENPLATKKTSIHSFPGTTIISITYNAMI
ncbi:hypothetical protein OPV22_029327 [Ensete ventricosum]|uniref:Uncharacterized protein n=1 Tax=Ensete ventricosum TaxID=4639 RepID=A0AAV8QCZ0_ENSVE|nr:hypothetical protein OPV22_029327 [Ensete ventricosum]